MLKLSQVAPHEWVFVYPAIYEDLRGQFDAGYESYEEGDLDKAEWAFRIVLSQMPDHLDALHHLAMILSDRNFTDRAHDLWNQAVLSVTRHPLKILGWEETAWNGYC